MSQGVNRCILVGNLGRAPEVRYSQAGTAICTLRIAVTERRKVGETWEDQTEWMDVVTFGKTAENAGQYLDKGRQVYVEGRLQTRKYADKEGVEKYKTEVVANQVLFLGSHSKEPAEGGNDTESPAQANTAVAVAQKREAMFKPKTPEGGSSGGFSDEELPF